MPRLLVALCAGLVFALTARAQAPEGRFSQWVAASERGALGLPRLDSDQLGALDALVRRDASARASVRADPAAPSRFSQRLTADERRVTGLATLPAAEVVQLDAAVDRFQNAILARTLLAAPTFAPRTSRALEPADRKEERKVHGSFTLSYSWGSGGYSERMGAAEFTFEDPAGRYAVTVGYAESHIKGPDRFRLLEQPPR